MHTSGMRVVLLLLPVVRALQLPATTAIVAQPRHVQVTCCCPPLSGAEEFARGALEVDGLDAWWRQDPERVEVLVKMPEDASFKRDVKIDVSRKRISLDVCEKPVLVGDLAHGISKDDSEWFVEDDLDDWFAADDTRYLVVALKKLESYVDWPSPLTAADGAEGGTARRLLIGGGSDEAQQKATAQQLASYQVLQKLPSAVRGDVYAREPSDDGGALSDTLYFVGKVIAETASPTMSLATQGVLVKEHARRYLPTVFGGVPDERIVLWLAPGNTEMRVAQNEIRLEQWAMPPDEVVLPSAGACGFEPETAPPEHVGGADAPFKVRRDAEGKPLGAAFEANIVKPDEVPGAYEAWLKDQ